jgi:hypothetical protein
VVRTDAGAVPAGKPINAEAAGSGGLFLPGPDISYFFLTSRGQKASGRRNRHFPPDFDVLLCVEARLGRSGSWSWVFNWVFDGSVRA